MRRQTATGNLRKVSKGEGTGVAWERIPGQRRYRNTETGETISRRQYDTKVNKESVYFGTNYVERQRATSKTEIYDVKSKTSHRIVKAKSPKEVKTILDRRRGKSKGAFVRVNREGQKYSTDIYSRKSSSFSFDLAIEAAKTASKYVPRGEAAPEEEDITEPEDYPALDGVDYEVVFVTNL